jgi:hypothetical protein
MDLTNMDLTNMDELEQSLAVFNTLDANEYCVVYGFRCLDMISSNNHPTIITIAQRILERLSALKHLPIYMQLLRNLATRSHKWIEVVVLEKSPALSALLFLANPNDSFNFDLWIQSWPTQSSALFDSQIVLLWMSQFFLESDLITHSESILRLAQIDKSDLYLAAYFKILNQVILIKKNPSQALEDAIDRICRIIQKVTDLAIIGYTLIWNLIYEKLSQIDSQYLIRLFTNALKLLESNDCPQLCLTYNAELCRIFESLDMLTVAKKHSDMALSLSDPNSSQHLRFKLSNLRLAVKKRSSATNLDPISHGT